LTALVQNTAAKLEASKTSGSFLMPANIPGSIYIDLINISAELEISVNDNNQLDVTVNETVVEITGVVVEIDHWASGFIEDALDGVIDDFIADIEVQFANEMDGVLGSTLVDALGTLAFGFDFVLPSVDPESPPVTVAVKTDFSWVDFTEDGGTFGLRTLALPEAILTPYESFGAPARSGCGLNEQIMIAPKDAPMEIMMSDDMVNLILFAAWQGGFLEFDVPESTLGDLDLGSMGVKDLTVNVSGMLPPTISDCGPEGTLLLHLGDLKVLASMTVFNLPMDVDVYASISAPFKVGVEDGNISFGITEISTLQTELTVQQDSMIAFEPLLKDLIQDNLVPVLLEGLDSEALGGLPLPAIDLSTAVEGDIDAVVSIKPLSASRDGGNNIIATELDAESPDPKPPE